MILRKKSLGLLANSFIASRRMINFFESQKVLPKKLRCESGPEMASRDFLNWACTNNIAIEYIQQGKLVQNAFIESLNSRFRDECLNEELCHDLIDAKKKIEKWRRYYNEERQHSEIRMKTPKEFEDELSNKNAGII